MPKLNARKVETLRQPGLHGDGEGLYLRIGPTGAKSWILRTMVHGRRRDLGLGGASLVSLAEAREKARALRKVAREGGNPDALRKQATLTFWEAAETVHQQLLPTWKNAKHATTWIQSVRVHAKPAFGDRPIATVGTADVLSVLSPIWTDTPEVAKRLRQRLSTIFDWAKGAGHYPHENPVNGLRKALPSPKKVVEHVASMPWQDVPRFVAELSGRDIMSAHTLEFLILTASRSAEARGARWSEIDLLSKTWSIPALRMKQGRAHRVPLSPQAMAVLDRVKGLDTDLVFPSAKPDKGGQPRVQSDNVFRGLFERMKREGFTTHGFRSSFRDWASESAHAEREVAEAALSHAVGNEVERAYARSDLFERRRKLMDSWGRFCAGEQGAVVQMVRG